MDLEVLEESSSYTRILQRPNFGAANVFEKLRSEQCYLDARLSVVDNDFAVFQAHRVVLASVSSYFHKLFVQRQDPNHVFKLRVTEKCLHQILRLIYQGRLEVGSGQDLDDLFYSLRGLQISLGEPIDSEAYGTFAGEPATAAATTASAASSSSSSATSNFGERGSSSCGGGNNAAAAMPTTVVQTKVEEPDSPSVEAAPTIMTSREMKIGGGATAEMMTSLNSGRRTASDVALTSQASGESTSRLPIAVVQGPHLSDFPRTRPLSSMASTSAKAKLVRPKALMKQDPDLREGNGGGCFGGLDDSLGSRSGLAVSDSCSDDGSMVRQQLANRQATNAHWKKPVEYSPSMFPNNKATTSSSCSSFKFDTTSATTAHHQDVKFDPKVAKIVPPSVPLRDMAVVTSGRQADAAAGGGFNEPTCWLRFEPTSRNSSWTSKEAILEAHQDEDNSIVQVLLEDSADNVGFLEFGDCQSASDFVQVNSFLPPGKALPALAPVSGSQPWRLQFQMEQPEQFAMTSVILKRHFIKNRIRVSQEPSLNPSGFDIVAVDKKNADDAFKKFNLRDINGHKIKSITIKPCLNM